MPRILLLIFCLLISLSKLSAQQDPDTSLRQLSPLVQQAEEFLLKAKVQKAKKLYLQALAIKDDYLPALRGLAGVQEMENDFVSAAKTLLKIIKINPRFSRVIYFDIGQMHYRIGEYKTALNFFQQYEDLFPLPYTDFGINGKLEMGTHLKYQGMLENSIRQCIVATDSIKYLNITEVNNLGQRINTTGDDVFPFLTNDQKILFFTRRNNSQDDEDLYYSTKENNSWLASIAIDSSFNTNKNEGMITMTRDNRSLYFTGCSRPEVFGTCDIMRADVDSFKISGTRALPGYAMSEFWESQASISCDGQLLFFASNRKGGLGGTDIWMSERGADGSWGDPKNLGRPVNTEKDEEAPFITNDGKVLYFSSTGHLGLGEQDIFMSRLGKHQQWGFPVNLGPPVNTSYRELGFFLSADGYTGYFASNRPKGVGNMDIYHFQLSEAVHSDPITFVEGFVKDSITLEPIQTTLYPKQHAPVRTDEAGRFFLCLPAESKFDFTITEENYLSYHKNKAIPRWDNKSFFPINILLQPIDPPTAPLTEPTPIPIVQVSSDTLYFAFDKSRLRKAEKEQLRSYLQNFDPKQVQSIELVGFCDYLGSKSYNLRLSQKRAEAVGRFLEKEGFNVESIRIEGKGEIEDGRDRKWNRRVEIKIKSR